MSAGQACPKSFDQIRNFPDGAEGEQHTIEISIDRRVVCEHARSYAVRVCTLGLKRVRSERWRERDGHSFSS